MLSNYHGLSLKPEKLLLKIKGFTLSRKEFLIFFQIVNLKILFKKLIIECDEKEECILLEKRLYFRHSLERHFSLAYPCGENR